MEKIRYLMSGFPIRCLHWYTQATGINKFVGKCPLPVFDHPPPKWGRAMRDLVCLVLLDVGRNVVEFIVVNAAGHRQVDNLLNDTLETGLTPELCGNGHI